MQSSADTRVRVVSETLKRQLHQLSMNGRVWYTADQVALAVRNWPDSLEPPPTTHEIESAMISQGVECVKIQSQRVFCFSKRNASYVLAKDFCLKAAVNQAYASGPPTGTNPKNSK